MLRSTQVVAELRAWRARAQIVDGAAQQALQGKGELPFRLLSINTHTHAHTNTRIYMYTYIHYKYKWYEVFEFHHHTQTLSGGKKKNLVAAEVDLESSFL